MHRRLAATCAVILCLVLSVTARAQVPADIQAELATHQLQKAVEDKNHKLVLQLIEARKTRGDALPADYAYYQAAAHLGLGNLFSAHGAILRYFKEAGKKGTHYRDALTLYSALQSAALQAVEAEIAQANSFARQNLSNGVGNSFGPIAKKNLSATFRTTRVGNLRVRREQPPFVQDSNTPCYLMLLDVVSVDAPLGERGIVVDDALGWIGRAGFDLHRLPEGEFVDLFGTGRRDFIRFAMQEGKTGRYEASIPSHFKEPTSMLGGGPHLGSQWFLETRDILIAAPGNMSGYMLNALHEASKLCRIAVGQT